MAGSEPVAAMTTTIDAIRVAAGRHALLATIARGFAHAGRAAGIAVDSERLLLLVSGGSDSMALLLAAVALAERGRGGSARLAVLSLDHGLRAESAEEVAFVAEWARALGVADIATERLEIATGGNLLANAREARYRAARCWQRRFGCAAMVTAHQADDRAETALLALARGGDADAVAGPRWARWRGDLAEPVDQTAATTATPMRTGPDPWLLRPLLGVSRSALRAMLGEVGMPWIEDPSNAGRARGTLRGAPATAAWVEAAAAHGGAALDDIATLLAWREREVARIVEGWSDAIPRAELEALDPALRGAAVQNFLRRRSRAADPRVEDGAAATRRTIEGILDAVVDGTRRPLRWRLSPRVEVVLDRVRLSVEFNPPNDRAR